MKGFISILEAFLAITLIYIVLTQIQINLPTRYSDSANLNTLHRYAHDIAFSICGNAEITRNLLNDTISFDLDSFIPPDMCYKVSVFENSSNNHLLDSLIYNYTASLCNTTNSTPSATSSCLIAGGAYPANYSASYCYSGSDCLSSIQTSNNNRVNLLTNQNFNVSFLPDGNGSMVEFMLEGYHNQSGTTYLYDSAGKQMASYNFSTSIDEVHLFDLSDFLPDSNNQYNITIEPDTNASYDYAYLNISFNTYSPKMIAVQTWNAGN